MKDVAECGLIPAFDVGLKILEMLLKLEHLGTWWWSEGLPSCVEHFLEAWVSEPEGFKAKRSFGGVSWSGPLERDGPMIRT